MSSTQNPSPTTPTSILLPSVSHFATPWLDDVHTYSVSPSPSSTPATSPQGSRTDLSVHLSPLAIVDSPDAREAHRYELERLKIALLMRERECEARLKALESERDAEGYARLLWEQWGLRWG